MLDKELWRLGFRRPGCVFVCYARIGLGRPRDFCGLPMRRDEGRVVYSPLVFKRVFLRRREESAGSWELEGESPGSRELEESAEEETWSEIGVERKEGR
ncbi:hypothetical protein TNCV_1109821 [Trichonephila clavipes]|nr:hypothetical protein TNCV_1109821 [Trichonephila clavipes]